MVQGHSHTGRTFQDPVSAGQRFLRSTMGETPVCKKKAKLPLVLHAPDVMESDRRRPKVKIQPPVFKGLPGERPDVHLLATSDWMEAMRLAPDDFIDNFKHTLQHLAHANGTTV